MTEVQKLTHEKLQAIDDDFAQIEISRSKKMTELYNRSGKLLKQNAFVPADVCQTVIDREILEMNNSVLKNHRQILNVKQICTDKITFDSLDAEKEFASHKATWKTLQIEQFIKVRKNFLVHIKQELIFRSFVTISTQLLPRTHRKLSKFRKI